MDGSATWPQLIFVVGVIIASAAFGGTALLWLMSRLAAIERNREAAHSSMRDQLLFAHNALRDQVVNEMSSTRHMLYTRIDDLGSKLDTKIENETQRLETRIHGTEITLATFKGANALATLLDRLESA